MIITNENRNSPYVINPKPSISTGISNFENSKSNLETENKILKEKLTKKEKELIIKDKTIKDLQDKITKLEIENRNLRSQGKH